MTQQFVPYAGVPVGDLVLELANDFDREYAVRRRLVNAIYHLRDVNLDGGFLSAICREMRFVKVCTRDVRRETAIVLHTQYDHIIKRLVYGKTIERDPVMLFLVEPLAQQLRAEWIGCNMLIGRVPDAGKSFIVRDGKPVGKHEVIEAWRKTLFLLAEIPETRGWLIETLNCVESTGRDDFSLAAVYA